MQWSKYCIEDTKSAKNSQFFKKFKTIVHFLNIEQKQKVLNFLTIIKIVTKDFSKNCSIVAILSRKLLLKFLEKLSELIEFLEKINLINGHHPLVVWP
jgi:flagellar biosynthesis/type III secretory pathway chaperone